MNDTQELVRIHGFELLERLRYVEVYRRGKQFVVRDLDTWYAKAGASGTFATWVSPGYPDKTTAFVAGEVAQWGDA